MPLSTPVPTSAVSAAPAEPAPGTGAIAACCAAPVALVKSAAHRLRVTAPAGVRFAEAPAGPDGPTAPTPRGARVSTGPAGVPAGSRKA